MKTSRSFWVLILLVLMTFMAWRYRDHQMRSSVVSDNILLHGIPDRVIGLNGKDSFFPEGIILNLGVDEYVMRQYEGDGKYVIWLYVGYYRSQQQGVTFHSPLRCYPGGGWEPLQVEVETLPIPSLGKAIRINRFIVKKGDIREIVYYWYQERGRVITSEYTSKFYQVYDSIFRGRNDGALVRFSIRSGPETMEATQMIREAIQEMYPSIYKTIPR